MKAYFPIWNNLMITLEGAQFLGWGSTALVCGGFSYRLASAALTQLGRRCDSLFRQPRARSRVPLRTDPSDQGCRCTLSLLLCTLCIYHLLSYGLVPSQSLDEQEMTQHSGPSRLSSLYQQNPLTVSPAARKHLGITPSEEWIQIDQ